MNTDMRSRRNVSARLVVGGTAVAILAAGAFYVWREMGALLADWGDASGAYEGSDHGMEIAPMY